VKVDGAFLPATAKLLRVPHSQFTTQRRMFSLFLACRRRFSVQRLMFPRVFQPSQAARHGEEAR